MSKIMLEAGWLGWQFVSVARWYIVPCCGCRASLRWMRTNARCSLVS